MHFDVRGDDITITDVVVDETGRAERGENTFRADGSTMTITSDQQLIVLDRLGEGG